MVTRLGTVLFLAVFTALALANLQEFIHVKRVIDGDTIMLESGERVRLIGVDTPESADPRRPVERFGKEAAAFTRGMVLCRDEEGNLVRSNHDGGFDAMTSDLLKSGTLVTI